MSKSLLEAKKQFRVDENGRVQIHTALEDVKREIAIMKKLDHRNLATLYEVIENAKTDKIYIVMQYCSGGQIIDWDE